MKVIRISGCGPCLYRELRNENYYCVCPTMGDDKGKLVGSIEDYTFNNFPVWCELPDDVVGTENCGKCTSKTDGTKNGGMCYECIRNKRMKDNHRI